MGQPWANNVESPQGPDIVTGEMSGESSQSNRQRMVIGGLIAGIVVAGVGGFALGRGTASGGESPIAAAESAAASQVRLKSAYDSCYRRDKGSTMTLADGGASIVVDTGSEYGSTAGMDCVLDELSTSQSIMAQIGRTTAMMGVQDAEADGLAYSWSYHPDNGVNMVIEYAETGDAN